MTQIKISIDAEGEYCNGCQFGATENGFKHTSYFCVAFNEYLLYRLDDGLVRCQQCLAATVEE